MQDPQSLPGRLVRGVPGVGRLADAGVAGEEDQPAVARPGPGQPARTRRAGARPMSVALCSRPPPALSPHGAARVPREAPPAAECREKSGRGGGRRGQSTRTGGVRPARAGVGPGTGSSRTVKCRSTGGCSTTRYAGTRSARAVTRARGAGPPVGRRFRSRAAPDAITHRAESHRSGERRPKPRRARSPPCSIDPSEPGTGREATDGPHTATAHAPGSHECASVVWRS